MCPIAAVLYRITTRSEKTSPVLWQYNPLLHMQYIHAYICKEHAKYTHTHTHIRAFYNISFRNKILNRFSELIDYYLQQLTRIGIYCECIYAAAATVVANVMRAIY